MTLSTTERQVKRAWRAELKGSLEETLGEMIVNPEFIPLAQQLFVLDDVKTRIGHQVRANAQNTLIGNSEHYPEILRLQRDKEVDRKILSIVCNELEDSERRMIGNKGEVAHILDKERKRISEFKETVRQMVYNV